MHVLLTLRHTCAQLSNSIESSFLHNGWRCYGCRPGWPKNFPFLSFWTNPHILLLVSFRRATIPAPAAAGSTGYAQRDDERLVAYEILAESRCGHWEWRIQVAGLVFRGFDGPHPRISEHIFEIEHYHYSRSEASRRTYAELEGWGIRAMEAWISNGRKFWRLVRTGFPSYVLERIWGSDTSNWLLSQRYLGNPCPLTTYLIRMKLSMHSFFISLFRCWCIVLLGISYIEVWLSHETVSNLWLGQRHLQNCKHL